MSARSISLSFALGVVCALVLAACGDEPSRATSSIAPDSGQPDRGRPDLGNEPDGTDEPDGDHCDPVLSAPNGTVVTTVTGSSTELVVELADCDGVIQPDALVSFDLLGEAGGAQLQARTALTDADGLAEMTLTAGDDAATFSIDASVPDAATLTFDVTVSEALSGTIEVTIQLAGSTTFDGFRTRLFETTSCADIGPYDFPEPSQAAADVSTPATHPTFTEVPIGGGYAVIVLADREAGLLGYGCTDEIVVPNGGIHPVTVTVGEIPIVFTGVYELDNRFDLTGSLPPSVATALQVFDEMTDDDSLTGNNETEDYGLDPAAFLLDFVYREICCWEATGSDPDWDSCRAQEFQHPYGDLEDLYTHDFTSWGGAQPSTFGLCGALAFGNETVMDLVQDLIVENVPDVVLLLAQMVGDLSRAFTDMHIISELTISNVSIAKGGNFTHVLETMIVELHDFDGDLHIFEFALADAGLTNLAYSGETTASSGDVLQIPDHAFRVDFGRLLRYIYLNGLLPILDCDADGDGVTEPCDNTGELFATWVDCTSVGVWMEANISNWFSAATYAGFCHTGMQLAGFWVEGEITGSLTEQTTIALEGSCEAGALDEQRRATELTNGLWSGTIVEDAGEPRTFFGSFTGVRTGDIE